MASSDKSLPLVLVVGATGATGQSIVQGLLDSRNFRVAALVRPSSQNKPATEQLRASGVEIRLGDVLDGVEKLKELLVGVDVVVSAVVAWRTADQKDLFRAAKEVGMKRVVPCDFGTPGKRGVRVLHDQKLAIRDFIKELGVPYTFIDVSWWMQLALPVPTRSRVPDAWKASSYALHGAGDKKMLVTDLRHIGLFVAHIIADPRTLNHAVIVWEDEVTQPAAHEIGERASGEGEVFRAKRSHVSVEQMQKLAKEARAEVAQDPSDVFALMKLSHSEYMYSIHILGENSLESAKALGYLDARALYPDLPKHSLEEFSREYYSLEEPGQEYMRYD